MHLSKLEFKQERIAGRYVWSFCIDGESVFDTAQVSPFGWVRHPEQFRDWLLGERLSPFASGRIPITVCAQDADLDCGALTARVRVEDNVVTWSDFTHEVPYVIEGEDPALMPIAPIHFDKTQYRDALSQTFLMASAGPSTDKHEQSRFHTLEGTISSVGFESGDRFVIGDWKTSPIGPMVDVMWVKPDGTRVLMAADEQIAAFVGAVYEFDETIVDDSLQANEDGFSSQRLNVSWKLGRSIKIPFRRLRTPGITKNIEGPIARVFLHVKTYGITKTDMFEWYQADRHTRITDATGTLDGGSLGRIHDLRPKLDVGFSEPPKKPSRVHVRPRIHDPKAKLDVLLAQLRQARSLPSVK